MDRMGFNPISPFNGPFNRQQKKTRPLNGAKDGLKSVTCEQTLTLLKVSQPFMMLHFVLFLFGIQTFLSNENSKHFLQRDRHSCT